MAAHDDTQFGGIAQKTWDELYQAAFDVQKKAYTPYSKFKVGAAFLMENDKVYAGCNVENASFGATICAERGAICTAVADGAQRARALAVISDIDPPAAPCGICRQVLAEFADDLPIMIASTRGTRKFTTLDALLPNRFSQRDLES